MWWIGRPSIRDYRSLGIWNLKYQRAMLAGDMVQEVGSVFQSELEQTT